MTEQQMHCPPAETLAEFAEGTIERSRIPDITAHLETCEICMTALEMADTEIAERAALRPSAAKAWWLSMAAAVAIVAISIAFFWQSRSPLHRLVAASPRSARVIEPRLTGGFPWATYGGPMRAGATPSDPERLRLAGAAADAIERGNAGSSTTEQHTAGVALVLIGDELGAVSRLRLAAERAPNDATAWNDLAAVEYAAAARLDRASLYPESLGHAEHALRIDPNLPEALFNRALALERLGLAAQARDAWNRYLAVDPGSAWAKEAREHLAQLASSSAAALFKADEPRFVRAAADGDVSTVRQLVDRHRERARTFAEAEYLGRWADAAQNGRLDDARHWLTVARAIGDALLEISGESLLHDAVRAIDARGNSLAEAHLAYRRGRVAYSQHRAREAEPELRRASAAFAAANDPLSFVARFYAASTRIDQHDLNAARAELDSLAHELRAHSAYIAAAANVQWGLSECRRAAGDMTGAVSSLADAAARFERLGETSNLASIEILRAAALDVLGRPDDAWKARVQGLTMESHEQKGDRLALDLETASRALMRAQRYDAARAFLGLEEQVQRDAHAEGLLVHTLARKAQLDAEMGNLEPARKTAAEALAVASQLSDPALRARETAVAELAQGAVELPRDPRRARDLLTRALDGLSAASLLPGVAEASLLRARAALLLGERDGAARDLEGGITALDRLRVPFAGGATAGVYDTGAALFVQSVRLRLDAGDVPGALAEAEHARGAALDVHKLQQQLAGSGTAVVESFVDGDDVIVFAVSDRALVAGRGPLPAGDDNALYDALIRPAETVIGSARRLVIVPDARFAAVPYAALSDGTRRLVERMPVALATSAASLVRAAAVRPVSIAAMALPANDVTVALPDSESEVAAVARLYPRGVALPASLGSLRAVRADVLHIAGHTGRTASDDAALIFGTERVAWNDVAGAPMNADVVTLSACETLRDPAQSGVRALSLGAGFLAAGAHDVVGTLGPIADRAAREIFLDVHRQLAAGVEPSEAVRRAQLDDLAHGGTVWRALTLVTKRIVP